MKRFVKRIYYTIKMKQALKKVSTSTGAERHLHYRRYIHYFNKLNKLGKEVI